jgi:glycerophosphoryl diester phosphodiesterase
MRVASGQLIEILAHRGVWQQPAEGNSRAALRTALANGWGLETDIRDHAGEIVIAHDPPVEAPFTLRHLLEDYRDARNTATIALNIKADGLCTGVQKLLDEFGVTSYFVFDMSVPDMLHWDRAKMRYFTRHSDVERDPVLYERAAGVWLDGFYDTWFTDSTIVRHLNEDKDVCVVSPELHRRDPAYLWPMLAHVSYETKARLSLCTDLPAKFQSLPAK